MPRIAEIFSKHHLEVPAFVGEGTPIWYRSTFVLEGKEYRLEVYKDIVVMHQDQGRQYFECYMPEEFGSEAALIEGFATRLDRYLSGGPWAGPDEKSFLGLVKDSIGKLFRR